jgi:hypothetical protein
MTPKGTHSFPCPRARAPEHQSFLPPERGLWTLHRKDTRKDRPPGLRSPPLGVLALHKVENKTHLCSASV